MVRNLGELGLNLQKIITRLENNQDLMKLIWYTDKDPLNGEDLSRSFIKENIFNKRLKIVPRVGPQENAQCTVVVRVIKGNLDAGNNQFRNISIGIEVFVPMTQWLIKDSNLRPFAILGEIQKSLSGKVIDGLGKIEGGDFSLNFLTDEMSNYEMVFRIEQYD